MIIRAGRPDDAAAMAAVAIAAEAAPGPIGSSADTPGIPEAGQIAYFGHLLSRARVAVAEGDGAMIGFGATAWTGRALHLADLFVRPERQGHGIGRRLLEAIIDGTRPLTTFASDDPRALPLYVRAGMDAWWPNLYLAGDPTRLAATPDGYEVTDAPLAEVAQLERQWAGLDRTPELPYWATLPGGQAAVVRRDGAIVGAGFVRDRLSGPGRWVDHALVAPDALGPPALLALVRHGLAGAPIGGACVPGPSALVRTLLEAGFTIRDRDTFLASDPSIVDPHREIVNTGFL
jgi:GNAT superfamily N-acetyltransferase